MNHHVLLSNPCLAEQRQDSLPSSPNLWASQLRAPNLLLNQDP